MMQHSDGTEHRSWNYSHHSFLQCFQSAVFPIRPAADVHCPKSSSQHEHRMRFDSFRHEQAHELRAVLAMACREGVTLSRLISCSSLNWSLKGDSMSAPPLRPTVGISGCSCEPALLPLASGPCGCVSPAYSPGFVAEAVGEIASVNETASVSLMARKEGEVTGAGERP